MKTKLITLISLIIINFSYSQIGVVALHSPINGVQYFNGTNPFISAYNAAVDNDTIYLHGGVFTNPTKFEKKLIIFGAGHFPNATQATLPTRLNGDFNISIEASGLHIEGVTFSNRMSFDENEAINNVTIKRCKFESDIYIGGNRSNPATNNFFLENVIQSFYTLDNLVNSYFISNIIQSNFKPLYQNTLLNNISLFSYVGSYNYFSIDAATDCVIKNNIFINESNKICASGNSVFSHNLFTNSNPILGTSPVLISNYTLPRTDILINQSGSVFDYNHNYHLQSGAVVLLGDDNKEVGIYGGLNPFKEESIPVNPHIENASINQNASNGLLNVNIQVQAQNR